MKCIRSISQALKALKSNNILFDGRKYYLSDFHKTTVYKNVAEKLINLGYVYDNGYGGSWFEVSYSLKHSVDRQKGIDIYCHMDQEQRFFYFILNNKVYKKDTLEDLYVELGYQTAKLKK